MVKSVILKDMNIFFLSFDPSDCAELYCDQHVVKILLEIVQMLYTAWHFLGPPDWNQTAPLKNNSQQKGYLPVSNPKHGMVMWVRSSEENYKWVCRLGLALSSEFTRRFKKIHSCDIHIKWLSENIPQDFMEVRNEKAYYSTKGFPKNLTAIPQCMKEQYHHNNVLIANIKNYLIEKSIFARWTHVYNS